ncbi:MAG: 4Fe-4S binding protein [Elusimicrobiota bacterium]
MRYPKLRELKEALTALIKGPYTTKFPKVPHIPFPRFRGKPVPDEKGCIGCGACEEVCPPRAIEIKDVVATRYLRWRHDYCIYCGQCERLCTTKEGVKLSNTEFDLAALKRDNMFSEIKKELTLCSQCGTIIAPKDQILYVAKKLGAQAYSNINIIALTLLEIPCHSVTSLTGLTQRELLDNSEIEMKNPADSSQPIRRQSAFKVLCPKCRYQQWVFDDYGKTY